jgi:hypothetical protein
MNEMWGCWTTDITVGYLFDRMYNFIDQPNFVASFTTAMVDLLEPVHMATHFPSMLRFLKSLPDPIVTFLQPGMSSVIEFNRVRQTRFLLILKLTEALGNGGSDLRYPEKKKQLPIGRKAQYRI